MNFNELKYWYVLVSPDINEAFIKDKIKGLSFNKVVPATFRYLSL